MRYITIAIEDNTAQISDAEESYRQAMQRNKMMEEEIANLQTDAVLQMLSYIHCVYRDFREINKKDLRINVTPFTLCVSQSYIDIYEIGFPGSVYGIKAAVTGDKITVMQQPKNNVMKLMQIWPKVKFALHESINHAIQERNKQAYKQAQQNEEILQVAKDFEL